MPDAHAVDCHAHVFSAHAPSVPGARYRPEYAADLSAWRAQWKPAGITHGVVVQPSFFGADNREMLDTIAAAPKHLRGVAVLTPYADAATLDRFAASGVRAMRLNLRGVRDYAEYAKPSWRALFDRVHERGWHVECFVDPGRLSDITPALDGSPIAVVLDHFGMPGATAIAWDATFAAAERLARTRDVWVKLSGPYRLEGAPPRDLASRWIDAVGRDRLVWGSDWPWTGYEGQRHSYAELRSRLDEWIDPSLSRAILWDNPARLYGFS